jgi:hypothetical protein
LQTLGIEVLERPYAGAWRLHIAVASLPLGFFQKPLKLLFTHADCAAETVVGESSALDELVDR